jgi:hypothetical protein
VSCTQVASRQPPRGRQTMDSTVQGQFKGRLHSTVCPQYMIQATIGNAAASSSPKHLPFYTLPVRQLWPLSASAANGHQVYQIAHRAWLISRTGKSSQDAIYIFNTASEIYLEVLRPRARERSIVISATKKKPRQTHALHTYTTPITADHTSPGGAAQPPSWPRLLMAPPLSLKRGRAAPALHRTPPL